MKRVWLIEPRDPLIARDGRPFTPDPGAIASSLPFPNPSTTAGGVRTRDGLGADGRFDTSQIERVKNIEVHGPLLAELLEPGANGRDQNVRWYFHTPSDAVVFEHTSRADTEGNDPSPSLQVKPLFPLAIPRSADTDLGHVVHQDLALVGMPQADKRKPYGQAPTFWSWEFFSNWLQAPQPTVTTLRQLGVRAPVYEQRTHVAIDPGRGTAQEQMLFTTRGLEFSYVGPNEGLAAARRFALAVATDAPNLKEGYAPLGGERRLMRWYRTDTSLPDIPAGLVETIVQDRHCRIVLLTPAVFALGWEPGWLFVPDGRVKLRLKAAAVSHHHTTSGWDLSKGKGQVKPTRRLAPAGSVYYCAIEGTDDAIARWVRDIWMQPISDELQDRRDGFGLAVVGKWDGKLAPLEVGA